MAPRVLARSQPASRCTGIACDAYDLLFQQPSRFARDALLRLGVERRLVISSETGGDTGAPLDRYYRHWHLDGDLPPNRFLNSGSVAGTRRHLVSFYERCLEISAARGIDDDQVLGCLFAAEHPDEVHIDMGQEVFGTVHGWEEERVVLLSPGQIAIPATGHLTIPATIHTPYLRTESRKRFYRRVCEHLLAND